MKKPQVSAEDVARCLVTVEGNGPVLGLLVTDIVTQQRFIVCDSGPRLADTRAAYMAADPAVLEVEVIRDDLAAHAGAGAA